ncbi:MAG: VCBS repeat-containing protein [Planctomycetota bacterium]|nr:VCBS repeat-containing protein [Planctomycetota bacterium]
MTQSTQPPCFAVAPFALAHGIAFFAATWSANGQVQFADQTSTRFPTQLEYTNQLSMCDIDNDGDLDIVFANGQGYSTIGVALKPRVYINNGAGVFADQTDARVGTLTGWFRGVEFGDVDRDGDWDMLLAQDFAKPALLLINNGAGVFANESATRMPVISLTSSRGQFGDVDNDGDLDIALTHSGGTSHFGAGAKPKLYLNNGSGVFTDAPSNVPALIVAQQMDILFLDVDGDLDLDIHLGTRATSTSSSKLYKNDGSGVFTSITMPNDNTAYSYDAGDIDGDGDLDLIGVNAGVSNQELLLRNTDGIGTVWTNISSQIAPNPTSDDNDSRFFDIDMDGDLDLIVAALGAPERIYRNNGTGSFAQVAGIITSNADSSLDVKVGDVDNDGDFDIVTAQGESGSFQNRIYINVGPADSIAPNIVNTEHVVGGTQPSAHTVRAEIRDQMTSDRGFHDRGVHLVYTVNGGAEQTASMNWSGNNMWRGTIPAQSPQSTVSYRVRARDWNNNLGFGTLTTYTEGGNANPADINGDGLIDGNDLAALLSQFGNAGGSADIDGSGLVDAADLAVLLAAWQV